MIKIEYQFLKGAKLFVGKARLTKGQNLTDAYFLKVEDLCYFGHINWDLQMLNICGDLVAIVAI